MHGAGHRRVCPSCGQSVTDMRDCLANLELRGPRQITSSNVDRIFDDGGRRFLVIEEKAPDEQIKRGQLRMLRNLAGVPVVSVWGVRGTPDRLKITEVGPGSSTLLAEGTWADYQSAVDAWFASDPTEQRLAAASQVPFTAPDWCPPDVWDAFDKATVAVHNAKARWRA